MKLTTDPIVKRARCGCPTFDDSYVGVCWGRCKRVSPNQARAQVIDFWIRVLRIVAIALGVWGALYLLLGDTAPEAKGQMPRIEASIGRTAEIPPIIGMTQAPTEESAYSSMVKINHHQTFDFGDIQFFEIAFGFGQIPDGSRATLSVDGDLALAKWLAKHHGQRVQLVLRVHTSLTRDGEK